MNVKLLYMKCLFSLLFLMPFTQSLAIPADYITYVEGDVYSVINYKPDHHHIDVLIKDWYEKTEEWYRCPYCNDWCYPVFYPTLAVRYGKRLNASWLAD